MYEVDNIVAYRIIDSTKQYLETLTLPIDVKISLDIEGDKKTLEFKVDDVFQIREEDYLKCFGQEWVVKEISKDGQLITVLAQHNIEKMSGTPVSSMNTESLSLIGTLNTFFGALDTLDYGGNWSYSLDNDILLDGDLLSRVRTIDLNRVMAIDVIESIAKTWFLEVEYDTLNKVVKFYQERGSNKGSYFSSQLNLRKIELKSDTYDFVTRLIPIGAEDLNISSINGGSVVVSNFQYSDKVITAYWIDNRYTHPEHLMEDAILKLADLSKPLKTYSCDIIDLSEDYPLLSYGIGDTVTIIDETLGIRDIQRINKMVVYPYHPEDNTAEMANRRATFDELQNELVDTRDTVYNTYYPNGKIVFNEVSGLSNFKQTVETDIGSLTSTITTLQEDVANIDASAYVIVLGNESQSLQVDSSNKLVADTYFGTTVSTYLGSARIDATIGNVRTYSSSGIEIPSMVINYNENNITDTESGSFPSFYGDYEVSATETATIDGDYVKLSGTSNNMEYVIGSSVDSGAAYWTEPELPFTAGQKLTFAAYVKTGLYTLQPAWTTPTTYYVDDRVSYNNQNYVCTVEHTSTDFTTDIANWSLVEFAYIQINEWTEDAGVYTKSSYKSSGFQMSQEGYLITNHTVSSNATNITLSIHCDSTLSGTYDLWFKFCKLEEGFNQTDYTPLLDIPNNFEIKNPSQTEDGFVETTLTSGTVIPVNVGYIDIPIEVSGTTFFKRMAFSRVDASLSVTDVNISATSQIMHSDDGGGTFTPNFVRLYPLLSNVTFTKWQYSYDGYVFYDIAYGTDTALLETSDGIENTLYISSSSVLFTQVIGESTEPRNTLIFKLVGDVAGSERSDTITISKAYDYTATIEALDASVRTDISALEQQTTQIRNDLYYYDSGTDTYVPYTSDYSEFKQQVDNFMITVQDGGGANLLRDSVGYNYPDSGVWTLVSGSVTSSYPSSWGLNYISKRSWYSTEMVMYQDIVVQPATEYTVSCAIKKEILGRVRFSYIAGTNTVTMFDLNSVEYASTAKYTWNSGANTRFRIIMEVIPPGGETPPVVEITDVMASLGKISSWQQSNGELFTTNVVIDATGIKISGSEGNPSYTSITPDEFAGYYDNQRIFSLNGSKTEVQELVATGGGLYVAPVKLIQVSGTEPRAAFVWTGIQ